MRRAPDEDSADQTNPAITRLRQKKARQRRRMAAFGRTSAIVAALAVLVAAGLTWGTKRWVDDKFRQVAALDLTSAAIVDAEQQRGDENFLLVGSDSRKGAEAEDSVGGARSDTVLVVHVPQDRKRVVVVSFPPDLEIDRPACELWDPESGEYTGQRDEGGAKVKLNTAYQHGGPRCVTSVVQQVSGLAINHFVGIEFAGFDAMVDAVGGVQVCVQHPIEDQVLGSVVEQAGSVELTGDQALAFVRAEQVAGDPLQDSGRIRRQQQFLAALARKVVSERMLRDPGRLRDFVDAMAANMIADNVGVDQLLDLGRSLDGVEADRIVFATVPTTGVTNPNGNQELRAEDAKALFRALIDGAPLSGELPAGDGQPPATPPPAAIVPPDQIKMQVLNSTGESGLASQVSRRLRAVGFEVVKVDNGQSDEERTVVRYGPVRESQARTVAAAVPGAALQVDPAMGGAVELVLGADFQGEVQQVQPGEPAPAAAPAPGQPDVPAAVPAVETMNAADTSCA